MPRPPRTIVTTSATIVALMMFGAGCGGGSSSGSGANATDAVSTTTTDPAQNPAAALRVVQQALAATRASKSAHVATRFVYDTDALGTNTGSNGSVDFASGNAQWVSDLAGLNQGVVPANTPPSQLSMQARQVGNNLYISLPPAFAAAGITEPWVQVPANAPAASNPAAEVNPINARIPLAARAERPDAAFDLLNTVKGAQLVGPASVNGTQTTRYSVDANTRVLLTEIGLMSLFGNPTSAGALATIDDELASASTIEVDVDAAGRVRALSVDLDLSSLAPNFVPKQNPSQWRELRAEWDFDTFGAPASVAVPAPARPMP